MNRTVLTMGAVLGCLAVPASADISFSQRITVEGGGGLAMFSSSGDIITQIAGDRSRTESQMKMDSKLMGMMSGSGNSGSIVRLDKALSWQLLPDKREYTEVTFAETREQMQQALEQLEQSGGGGLPVSDEGCQWSDAKLQVEKSDEREEVAGIKTRKHVIRMQQTCTDPETGNACDMTWLMESWMAKKVPAEKEVRGFHEAYAEALGLGDTARHVQGPAQALIGMFGDNWEEVVDELDDIRGYPLRSVMQLGMGGEQCKTASGQPIAMDEMWENASTAAYNAALDSASVEAGSAIGRATADAMGGSIAGNIGGSAVGAAAGEIIGGLSGMFRKKKSETPEPEAAPAPTAGSGQVTLFRVTSEVTRWSEVTIPAERFEEPVDWTRR